MNGQPSNQVMNLGPKPKIKILQTQDKEEFEKEFHNNIIMGWAPSPVGHQMFFNEKKQEIITCFLCIFTRTG